MRSAAYYNEIDRYCCDWLQNLMDAGHITPGKIDDRRIESLSPDDVRGYERVHFFAGIGGWDHALNLTKWSGPVWTGSCPCQPFSAAGKGKAADDQRHLWPAWFSLIRECRPAIVFGEQVEAAIGWGWLDAVFADLEAESYACASAVLQLAASARRTSGSGFGSWPSPVKEDARSSARHGYMKTGNQGTTLLDASRMASWATPNASAPGGTPEQA